MEWGERKGRESWKIITVKKWKDYKYKITIMNLEKNNDGFLM